MQVIEMTGLCSKCSKQKRLFFDKVQQGKSLPLKFSKKKKKKKKKSSRNSLSRLLWRLLPARMAETCVEKNVLLPLQAWK